MSGQNKKQSIYLKKILQILIIMILIIGSGFFLYNYNFNMSFEEVVAYECTNFDKVSNTYWFSLRNEKYCGWFTEDYLNNFDIIIDFEPDYNKYTYVVTIGYELNSISYSFNARKNHVQFIGKVALDDKFTDKVYIYRIKAMNIDCDYHERDKYVYFVK